MAVIFSGSGYLIEDLIGTSRALLVQIYGVDLRMGQFEYLLDSQTDIQLTEGLETVKANIARALITEPGELFWAPDYGVGLPAFLNQNVTAEMFEEIRNRIRASLEVNDDIVDIRSIEAELQDSQIIIDVQFVLGAQPERINLSLRRTG